MADLALRLKVFLASPSDVRLERDIAEQELWRLHRQFAGKRLSIDAYRWEPNTVPTFHRVQSGINLHLRTAELTIAILWSTLGTVTGAGETGSQEELRIAAERVARGYSDDVFLYFKTAPLPATAEPAKAEAMAKLRTQLMAADGPFVSEFDTPEAFRDRLHGDLRNWIERWAGIPEICAYALSKVPGGPAPPAILGESRLARLRLQYDVTSLLETCQPLATTSMWKYQALGEEAGGVALDVALAGTSRWAMTGGKPTNGAFQPLVDAGVLARHGADLYFGSMEWFYFFCAAGLLDAVTAGDVRAVERRPYINPIHQYLQALAVGQRRTLVVPTLRRWLVNAGGVTEGKPVARNFAAYVLGMLGAVEAHEDLARVIDEDDGEGVREYCVASLGRMRARVQMPMLADLFKRTEDADLRLMIAQAISRMVGAADYPM